MDSRKRSGVNMSDKTDETDETSPLTGQSEGSAVKATACSRLQAPFQCWLRPAMWIPGVNRLHSHREVWKSEESNPQKNIENVQRALQKVIQRDKTRSDFVISKVEQDFLQIYVFTRAEWLDVIEMKFEDSQIKISAFSSGFLPLFFPGACFLNMMFFWVPFLDMGMNQKRLQWIKSQLEVPVQKCAL